VQQVHHQQLPVHQQIFLHMDFLQKLTLNQIQTNQQIPCLLLLSTSAYQRSHQSIERPLVPKMQSYEPKHLNIFWKRVKLAFKKLDGNHIE